MASTRLPSSRRRMSAWLNLIGKGQLPVPGTFSGPLGWWWLGMAVEPIAAHQLAPLRLRPRFMLVWAHSE